MNFRSMPAGGKQPLDTMGTRTAEDTACTDNEDCSIPADTALTAAATVKAFQGKNNGAGTGCPAPGQSDPYGNRHQPLYKIAQAAETGSESSLADVEDDCRIMSAMERQ